MAVIPQLIMPLKKALNTRDPEAGFLPLAVPFPVGLLVVASSSPCLRFLSFLLLGERGIRTHAR